MMKIFTEMKINEENNNYSFCIYDSSPGNMSWTFNVCGKLPDFD